MYMNFGMFQKWYSSHTSLRKKTSDKQKHAQSNPNLQHPFKLET